MAEMRESNNRKISEEALYVKQKIFERCLEDCFCLTPEQVETVLGIYKEKLNEQKDTGALNALKVRVDIDVSDALKGLKALRREANKTLKALEKVREATERDVINFVTNVTIQDTIDSERVAERIHKEIEEHSQAFMERFEAKRQRLSK
jgi:SpoVK/Ycf46/Vps4 family AAA+-type ATPase